MVRITSFSTALLSVALLASTGSAVNPLREWLNKLHNKVPGVTDVATITAKQIRDPKLKKVASDFNIRDMAVFYYTGDEDQDKYVPDLKKYDFDAVLDSLADANKNERRFNGKSPNSVIGTECTKDKCFPYAVKEESKAIKALKDKAKETTFGVWFQRKQKNFELTEDPLKEIAKAAREVFEDQRLRKGRKVYKPFSVTFWLEGANDAQAKKKLSFWPFSRTKVVKNKDPSHMFQVSFGNPQFERSFKAPPQVKSTVKAAMGLAIFSAIAAAVL